MEAERLLQIAETARHQLVSLTPTNVLLSWGIEKFTAITFNGMATLKFHVNGRLHQGYVLVAYNEMDYYEVYLLDEQGINATCVHNEVYFDDLGTTIDRAIESGENEEEYNEFCRQAFNELIFG